MKYLVNAELKAVRKGDFVEADENAGEFIFDSENNEHTKATLVGIAESNQIKISNKLRLMEYCELLFSELNKLKLPEQNNMTESAMIKEIVTEGVNADKEDNEILVALVNNGVSFKNAVKAFNTAMNELGFRISPKERLEKATAILDEVGFAPETFQDVQDAITGLCAKISSTNEKQALLVIRKYAKVNSIEMPKAVKDPNKAGGARGKVLNWMAANPSATIEEFTEFCESINKPKMVKGYWPIFGVAKAMADNMAESAKAA